MFVCEQCTEAWSENLLDLIDRCNPDELKIIQTYIEKKLIIIIS